MAVTSTIEWTDATWNPVRGCTKISPGCKHCYASTFAERFRGVPDHPYEMGFDLRLVGQKLLDPLRWPTPKRIFVNSMSDLFHSGVPDWFIARVVDVMAATPWHTYQVLTKRADRLAELSETQLANVAGSAHIWWGVSVEDRKHGVPRVTTLQKTNLRMKFLSIEPLLEDLGHIDLGCLNWVIVGGESGHGARPMHPDWVSSLRDQCQGAGVPFFFKQWGGRNKKLAGRSLDGRVHNDFPKSEIRTAASKEERANLMAQLDSSWSEEEWHRLIQIG